ncbi:putative mfs multidrug transporter [Erysiphe necator]|uniref:Putative mfs multidrug transporter n=1 Tax=Uncinula necator TaxID=52586 RepID=A0A0B1PG53_UNCNE|nr:putative mfs multidrug transporter [Erysiphe necator]
MANLRIPIEELPGSSTSTPSLQSSDYVDAPSSPTSPSLHNPADPQNQRLEYFQLSPAHHLPNEQPVATHHYHHLHQRDFELSSSTPLIQQNFHNQIYSQNHNNPNRNNHHLQNNQFSTTSKTAQLTRGGTTASDYLRLTSKNQDQVDLRTNSIDLEHYINSPSSDAGLKTIVPSLKGSTDSETSSRPPSPRDMAFAPLPGSGHVNIDEIPLNSPLDDLGNASGPTGFKPSRGFLYAFASICIITLAAALDATSLAIALPIITKKLGGTAIEAFWSGTSFLITSAVFQPIIASLSNIIGRKELILLSSLFFAVGSTLGAIANNFTIMLVGRSIQGIGGGGILTLGEIMLTDLVPLAYRGAWFGYLGSIWAIGSVTGPLMGASFAQRVTWRWIFWINLPIIITGSICIYFFLTLDKIPGKITDKLARFDWIGSVVFCSATVSFLIPMTWGGIMYPWNHWRTVTPLIFGVVGIGAFTYYEWLLSKKCWDRDGNPRPGSHVEPIIRFTIFNNATMILTYIQTVLHGIILWSLLYFLPLYYEGVKEYSLIVTGVAALPETGFVAPMAVMVGIVSAKTGHYRWAVWSGWGLTTFGAGLLVLLKPDTSVPSWILLNITVSIGAGMLFTAMGLAVQAAGEPEDAGHAAGFYSFARVIGQSLGVAVGGVVFQNQIYNNLMQYPLLAPNALAFSKEATIIVVIIKNMPKGPMKTQLVQAYSDALSMIWVVMCAVAGLGLLLSIFVKGYTLEQELKTQQGYKYDGVDGDEERLQSSYEGQKYAASSRNSHVYSGAMGSVSNLEMTNLTSGYGIDNANASTASLDKAPDGLNRRRAVTVNSTISMNGMEPKMQNTVI